MSIGGKPLRNAAIQAYRKQQEEMRAEMRRLKAQREQEARDEFRHLLAFSLDLDDALAYPDEAIHLQPRDDRPEAIEYTYTEIDGITFYAVWRGARVLSIGDRCAECGAIRHFGQIRDLIDLGEALDNHPTARVWHHRGCSQYVAPDPDEEE